MRKMEPSSNKYNNEASDSTQIETIKNVIGDHENCFTKLLEICNNNFSMATDLWRFAHYLGLETFTGKISTKNCYAQLKKKLDQIRLDTQCTTQDVYTCPSNGVVLFGSSRTAVKHISKRLETGIDGVGSNFATLSIYEQDPSFVANRISAMDNYGPEHAVTDTESVLSTEFADAGTVGIRNVENTCYMNVVLQCLSKAELLRRSVYRENLQNENEGNTGSLTDFFRVIEGLWTQKCSLDISTFKTLIEGYDEKYTGALFHDAAEFLQCLYQHVLQVLPSTCTDDPKRCNFITGKIVSSRTCNTCGFRCSYMKEDIAVLPLSLMTDADCVSVIDCFQYYIREELLEGPDILFCDNCQCESASTRRVRYLEYPPILVVQFVRFVHVDGKGFVKSTTYIKLDSSIDLEPFMENSTGPIKYHLYGIVTHKGHDVNVGHYMAYCKHPTSGAWYLYNDEVVSKSSLSEVPHRDVYLLFYELTSNLVS